MTKYIMKGVCAMCMFTPSDIAYFPEKEYTQAELDKARNEIWLGSTITMGLMVMGIMISIRLLLWTSHIWTGAIIGWFSVLFPTAVKFCYRRQLSK